MKQLLLVLTNLTLSALSFSQNTNQAFVASDIDNFWTAYDKIISTTDSVQQYSYLKEFYIEKASPGLISLLEVRNYTSKEFIEAINKYPKFWKSIRPNTVNYKELYPSIETDIKKLKKVYPDLKPSTIYFSIGAFRTNGTIQNDRILIGSELTLADNATIIDELPEWRKPFFKEYQPRKNIALLCTHEYIHTQQNKLVENLLSMCLYEGVAEFISCKATGKKSNSPAIEFGKVNQEKVINQFVADLFLMSNNYNWLWGDNTNQLKVRDLGYYIGYEICERYYNLSKDKTKAIKELIELDYTNEEQVERIVDTTKLLSKTLENLKEDYEKQRPKVASIKPFNNGSKAVKPGLTKITITFSAPLNGHHTGIDYGPLGETFCPKINVARIWSDNGKSWTFEADLKPNQHYQILISNNFRKQNGVRLKPYLIDFKTVY
jgi:hypothetical protein